MQKARRCSRLTRNTSSQWESPSPLPWSPPSSASADISAVATVPSATACETEPQSHLVNQENQRTKDREQRTEDRGQRSVKPTSNLRFLTSDLCPLTSDLE